VGRIQHCPPVALGEILPVVLAARSSAVNELRRALYRASHIEAPVEFIGRGSLMSAFPRPAVAFHCARSRGLHPK